MHKEYMMMALEEAKKALDEGDFPVGCVIVAGEQVVSRGRRRNSTSQSEMDHAEIMALRQLYSIYNDGLPENLKIYSTMEPCLMCYSTLILNNVQSIVYAYEDVMGGGTNLDLQSLKPLYSHRNVEIIPGILRDESLALFKKFFSSDESGYWKESLLAQYTLDQ